MRFIVDLEAGKPTAQIGKALQVLQTLGCSFENRPAPGTSNAMMRKLNVWWDADLVGQLTQNQHGELSFAYPSHQPPPWPHDPEAVERLSPT